MESIRAQNYHCADCAQDYVDFINNQIGVFLCQFCADTHQRFKMPIKRLDDHFSDDEIAFLSKSGNQKANSSLLIGLPPWVVTPKKYSLE